MRQWWALFRKDFRFFSGASIALIALLVMGAALLSFIRVYDPYFYRAYILGQVGRNFSLYRMMPIMILFSPLVMPFLFGTMYTYGLIAEHTGSPRVQLASLPIPGVLPLLSKMAAILGWMAVMMATTLLISVMHTILWRMFNLPPIKGEDTISLMIEMQFISIYLTMLVQSIVVMGLITAAHSLAVTFGKSLPTLIGVMVFIGGYVIFLSLPMPGLTYTTSLTAVVILFLVQTLMAVLFSTAVVVPSLALYARYREI
jgi:hypothetical protein